MSEVTVTDYNGPGDWSMDGVRARYQAAARALALPVLRDLRPREHKAGNRHWIYPVMEEVISGAKEGDLACVEVLVQYVESRHKQAFGRILHANTARVLRRSKLQPT